MNIPEIKALFARPDVQRRVRELTNDVKMLFSEEKSIERRIHEIVRSENRLAFKGGTK